MKDLKDYKTIQGFKCLNLPLSFSQRMKRLFHLHTSLQYTPYKYAQYSRTWKNFLTSLS